MTYNKVQDSGKRTFFKTGSQRDDRVGKGRYDLIATRGLRRLAKHYEAGSVKYNANNWKLGQPLSTYLDSALRHAFGYIEGKKDEDHLTAACWNLLAAIETEEMIEEGLLPMELGDLPYTMEKIKESCNVDKKEED